ncbi:hypothetical protein B0H14DRAFT_3561708 [Mycena olivaceomarginata]|nr:hypothetical protein B0H14DRAFT_3561708 [Mycena olivaceomarginata]
MIEPFPFPGNLVCVTQVPIKDIQEIDDTIMTFFRCPNVPIAVRVMGGPRTSQETADCAGGWRILLGAVLKRFQSKKSNAIHKDSTVIRKHGVVHNGGHATAKWRQRGAGGGNKEQSSNSIPVEMTNFHGFPSNSQTFIFLSESNEVTNLGTTPNQRHQEIMGISSMVMLGFANLGNQNTASPRLPALRLSLAMWELSEIAIA